MLAFVGYLGARMA